MITKTTVNTTENTVNESAAERSKRMMQRLMTAEIHVKPTLPEGHYTVVFRGVGFAEVKHKGADCSALRFSFEFSGITYEEDFLLYADSIKAEEVVYAKAEQHLKDIGAQFKIDPRISITFEELMKYTGQNLDIKVYMQDFTDKEGKPGKSRKFGFWKKPDIIMAEAAITSTEEIPTI